VIDHHNLNLAQNRREQAMREEGGSGGEAGLEEAGGGGLTKEEMLGEGSLDSKAMNALVPAEEEELQVLHPTTEHELLQRLNIIEFSNSRSRVGLFCCGIRSLLPWEWVSFAM